MARTKNKTNDDMIDSIDESCQLLLDYDLCERNEYFYKYASLIHSHRNESNSVFQTEMHHIVPRAYYRRNNLEVNNDKSNIVNLSHFDHMLSHYFLYKSAKIKWFRLANLNVVILRAKPFLSADDITDENLINIKDEYQAMSEERVKYIGSLHRGKYVSAETRAKLSNSLRGKPSWNKGLVGIRSDTDEAKKRKAEIQRAIWAKHANDPNFRARGKILNISAEGQKRKVEAILGKKVYHNVDGVERYFAEGEAPDGWIIGRSGSSIEKNRQGHYGQVQTSEQQEKKRVAMTGRKVYNNGKINKKFSPDNVPDGWVLGYIKGDKKK